MTFLNGIMLFGLIGVSIPIIIHILNRRRAAVVDWGAMQFLEVSLARRSRRILIEDIILMAIRCGLLAALAVALARPFLTRGRILAGETDDAQDLAIVIDGSLSMTLESSGRSNFRRAIDEAHQLVKVCRSGDAVSIILAGPTAQSVVPSPISDRDAIGESLDKLTAPGGSMRVLEALHAATLTLSAGTNPAKRIVLITDGQGIGWDLTAQKRWQFLAEAAESLPTRPIVIVRTLAAPRKWRNASAAALHFSRAIVGADRPVRITATIANTGEAAITPDAVELLINGKTIERRTIAGVAEGASSSVIFDHQFTAPGPHVVSTRLICADDLPGDNEITRVVDVPAILPVLILQGESSPKALKSDADFLKTAMTPPAGKNEKDVKHLIHPTVMDAADVAKVKDFSDYAVVVLANVPRLPGSAAEKLVEFVSRGGGLLIAPGRRAESNFYNNWNGPDGNIISGCRLMEIREDETVTGGQEQAFAHVAVNTINHPALMLLSDPSDGDLAAPRIKRHWVLGPTDNDKAVTVGASLACGDAYLVQRKLGKGFVLTLPAPMNTDFSDLPRHPCRCFVPLVHELVYYLAAPVAEPMNILPGQQFVYTLPAATRIGPAGIAEVVGPDGRAAAVRLRQQQGRRQATCSMTACPGLYRLILPGERAEGEDAKSIPFVVMSNPNESKLDLLTDNDYDRAGQFVQLTRAKTLGELAAAIRGGVPGSEVWQYVAAAILLLLAAEIATTRTIAAKRKMHLAEPVVFGQDRKTVRPAFAEATADRLDTVRPEEVFVR